MLRVKVNLANNGIAEREEWRIHLAPIDMCNVEEKEELRNFLPS